MAIGDIYQLKTRYLMDGEVANNVYYYRATSGSPSAPDLRAAFEFGVSLRVLAIMPSQATLTQIQTVNGMNNADQEVVDMSVPGTLVGIRLPTFIAAAFRRRVGGIGYRYSYKRFLAGRAADLDHGGAWTGSFINLMDEVAKELGETLEGVGAGYEPVQITGGFELGVSPTFKQVLLGNWQLNAQVDHQDTRQRYSWINATPA